LSASPDGSASRSPIGYPWPAAGGLQRMGPGSGKSVRELPWRDVPPVVPSLHRAGEASVGAWPRRSFLELGALPSAIPCARLHARQLIWEWGLDALSAKAELIVSELVTNAVQASRSLPQPGPVRLWLLMGTNRMLILVWDASEQVPVRMAANAETEGGRGLLLVEVMSSQWNWYSTPELGGKIVWALVTRVEDE
jgi:anti-sigma regulatory factor (Ser/Thr protein kinase)